MGFKDLCTKGRKLQIQAFKISKSFKVTSHYFRRRSKKRISEHRLTTDDDHLIPLSKPRGACDLSCRRPRRTLDQ